MAAGTDTEVVRASGFGLEEMVPALGHAARDFVALLRSLTPEDGDRPVPDMTWTAAETAVHMLTIVRRGMGDRRRADSLRGLARLNDECVAEVAERDPHRLADLLESDMAAYLELLNSLTDDDAGGTVVRLHAGVRSDIPTGLSYQLFDLLAHGDDIARATGRPWTIEPAHAALVLRASLPALRPWVFDDALDGPRQRAVFTFPAADYAIALELGGGEYAATSAARDDAEAEVDPVEMFLSLAGRREPNDPTIARAAAWYQPI